MYWFLYKDWDNERGLFFDGQEHNLRYTLNAREAKRRYEENKSIMVSVNIKRPPNIEVPVQIPLETDKLKVAEIDTHFLEFITKGNVSTRMEMILSKFMDNYNLGKDWKFYRRENLANQESESTKNKLALIMMKDVIMGMFRVTPLKVPVGKKKTDIRKTSFLDWDIGDDFSIDYYVQWERFTTNLFGIYTPKLYQCMLPDSDFNGYPLQPWQLDLLLKYGWVNYIIWPRGWGKSLVTTGMSSSYLLKQETDATERIQEFAVLYMGLSQKQNAPYVNYSKKMLNNLIDLETFAQKDWDLIYIIDWEKKRSLEFITTNMDDPARSRRTRFAVADEADYLDWDKVKTLMGTPDSVVSLISTIGANTQSWEFYRWWLNAYKQQREYEPIDVLINRIWRKYWMHLVTSRRWIQKKIDNGDFAKMRSEFLQARPLVALHYTLDDVAFLTDEQKDLQNTRVEAIGWYEYMLAENYGEYSTDVSVFNTDGLQKESPAIGDYVVLGYDEAESYDYPWLCAVIVSKWEYYVDNTWRLPKNAEQKFSKIKELMDEYKKRSDSGKVFFVADISRSEAVARELAMLWMPVDMQVRWTGNVDWRAGSRFIVGKSWCINMIWETFFASQNFHLDPKCYWDEGLVDEIKHFKRIGKKVLWEKKKNDDQVSAMLLCLFFLWHKEELWLKSLTAIANNVTEDEIINRRWVTTYQTPRDNRIASLSDLKHNLF